MICFGRERYVHTNDNVLQHFTLFHVILLLVTHAETLLATSEYRLKISVLAPIGSVWPKISARGSPPATILLVGKLE